jgi:hypothetical protein
MLVWSGAPSSSTPIAYDPLNDAWEALATGPVANYYGAWTGSRLVVVSPQPGLAGATFDPMTNAWTALEGVMPLPARPRFSFTAWMPSTNEVLVFGGYNDPSGFSDGAAYDFDTKTWRTVATGPIGIVDEFRPPAVAWVNDRLLVSGGGSKYGDRHQVAALYDPVGDTWSVIGSSPSPGYTAVMTALLGSRVVLWNGERFEGSDFNYPTNGGALFDASTAAWSSIPAIPGEGMYDGHIGGAIWSTGAAFGVWGGDRYGNGFSSDDRGALYDLASATWSALPPAPIVGRGELAGVWTGSEAIVWGGVDWGGATGDELADGAIFRP